MATDPPVPTFKVILLGDSGVGKTSMFQQFLDGTLPANPRSTYGFDCVVKDMELRNRRLKLELWDTGGQERFRSIVPSHYRRANAAILVYDVTKQTTLEGLTGWYEQLQMHSTIPPVMVVGNKKDLLETAGQTTEHAAISTSGQNFATRIGAFKHQTISAMERDEVRVMFGDLVFEMLFNAYTTLEQQQNNQTPIVATTPQQAATSGCRC